MALAAGLRQAGYAVAVCPGPDETERCPLAGSEGCALAHGADVVVSSLGLDTPRSREVLQALRTRCPEIPLVVEVETGQEDDWPALLDGCELVVSPVRPEQLVDAVRGVLAGTGQGG